MPLRSPCPCFSGQLYIQCCDPFHSDLAVPPTAEALMRSRYCAFVVLHSAYLLQTWHPRTRPRRIELDEEQRWTGLEILDRSGGGLFDSTGMVEFKAHYIVGDRAGVVHERSQFARHDNAWVYVGPVAAPTRAGR